MLIIQNNYLNHWLHMKLMMHMVLTLTIHMTVHHLMALAKVDLPIAVNLAIHPNHPHLKALKATAVIAAAAVDTMKMLDTMMLERHHMEKFLKMILIKLMMILMTHMLELVMMIT